MSDDLFELEGLYNIIMRKDFQDELIAYYRKSFDIRMITQLVAFAKTKGIECLELSVGRLVLFPTQSTFKYPACVIVSDYMLELDSQIWVYTGLVYLYFMEAGKKGYTYDDLAGEG